MAEKFKRRKRNYLINKDMQGKFALLYLLMTAAGFVFLGLFFAAASSDHLTISYENQAIEVGSTPRVLLGELLRSEGILLLLGGLLIILFTIVLTHRIAGPLYRFEQTLKAMRNNQLDQKIYLRKKDEGKQLGSLINEFNQELSNNLHKIREKMAKLPDSEEKREILAIVDRYQLLESSSDND